MAINDDRCGKFAVQLDSDDLYSSARTLQLIIEAGKEARPKDAERWLRIMVVPGFAKRWLMPRIETLRHLRPGLKLAIEPNSTFTEVDAKSADLGIAYGLDGQYAQSRVSLICPRVFPICTPAYLADTALQAGLQAPHLYIGELGWSGASGDFVDLDNAPVAALFKLYPWEWVLDDEFGKYAAESLPETMWIEPLWKSLLSNKAILAVLWEMYPGHPNLLPAYIDDPHELAEYVRKPKLGREGANVTIVGEPTPEKGFYYRSDHFSFAKLGVPFFNFGAGEDLVAGGKEAGKKAAELVDLRPSR
mgnify:CR=1 FL=1